MSDDIMMTPRRAAIEVGCSRTTILRAIQNGYLKAKKVPISELGNQEWYGIRAADLEEWNSSQHRRKRNR